MKTYAFRFNAQRAEPYTDGTRGAAVAYGRGCTLAGDERTCTYPEALDYLARFSAGVQGPHAAFLRLAPGQRAPSGFNAGASAGRHRRFGGF